VTTHVEAHPGWDRRRLVYGDWSWLVRDGLDVIRLAFFGGTIAFAVQGRSTAVALTAASVVLLIARIVDLPRWFDFGLIMAMTLIAYGTALGLYGNATRVDRWSAPPSSPSGRCEDGRATG
jgi:disulfide bond formation protein DsbB